MNSSLSIVHVDRERSDVEGYYELLGVDPSASDEEVRRAGKKLILETHPDVGGSEDDFIEAVRAYKTLSDPGRRAEYDARTDAPRVTLSAPQASFSADAFAPSGEPAWYKEPAMLMDDGEVERVRLWQGLVLEAARGCRLALEIKVGMCHHPVGYYEHDHVALIGRNECPCSGAAYAYILKGMVEKWLT